MNAETNSTQRDPFELFSAWFNEAEAISPERHNAMALATAGQDGLPSVRMVLLRGWTRKGFRFYTSYMSRKGRELAENPAASLLFYWGALGRQVRISGEAEKLPAEISDHYFNSRPKGSQIAAILSQQSHPVPETLDLETAFSRLYLEFENKTPARPHHWGGYRIVPISFEFWQNRPNRLHQRIRYRLADQDQWILDQLYP